MILSDGDILAFRAMGHLDITPWNPAAVQPASYDLRLAPYVTHIPRTSWIPQYGETAPEAWTEKFDDTRNTGDMFYFLAPGEFALFSTIETVRLDASLCAQVAGKSSWARQGLLIEAAGWVDPGFDGQLTLELKNLTQDYILLPAGAPICQIVFMQMRSNSQRPYGTDGLGSRYMNQEGPTSAR